MDVIDDDLLYLKEDFLYRECSSLFKNGDDEWESINTYVKEDYMSSYYLKNGVKQPLLEVIKMEVPVVIEDLKKVSQGIPIPEERDNTYYPSLPNIRSLCLQLTNRLFVFGFAYDKESDEYSLLSSEQKAFIKDLQSLLEGSLPYDEGEIFDDSGDRDDICYLGYRQTNASEVATRLENIWKRYQSII